MVQSYHKQTGRLHPAAEWALQQQFNHTAVDCTTTVVLKILDGKCKMLPGEMAAILEIYAVVRRSPGQLFGQEVHRIIDMACTRYDVQVAKEIHAYRLFAEANIPKPVMKSYKARLREGLFG